ncbi:MAG: zf-HC2 domain-containing protein [Aquabacterium sp.]|nr:zf-HC2 domain-containing protein [Aquabacterium sp.]
MTPNIDCKEVSRLLSAGMDNTMPVAERARLRHHLVLCDACRNVNDQFDLLRRAIRQIGRNEPPPQ